MKSDRFKTEQNYFETNASENENPFDLHYETGSQINPYEPTNETEYDYYQSQINENETPFNLHYLNEETNQTSQIIQSPSVENLWQSAQDSSNDNYVTDYVQYLYGYKDIISKPEFYKEENLLKARNFELFSSEIQDQEFRTVLSEIVDNAENRFEKYMTERGDNRFFENMLSDPNFGENFDRFFETEYGELIEGVHGELDRLSNFLEQNLDPQMSNEEIKSLVQCFEVEPEHLFGSLGKAIKGIVNKGKKAIGGALTLAKNVASKVGKTLLLSPFLRIITQKLKNSIRPVLKNLLEKLKGKLPKQYQDLAQKALDALNPAGIESGSGVVEPSEGNENIDTIGSSEELFELYNSESETFDLYELDEITEAERKLDREMYTVAKNFEEIQTNPYGNGEELGRPEAVVNEQYLDEEQADEASQQSYYTLLDKSRNEFVSGIADNSSNMRQLTQDFVPFVLPAIKGALKLTGARQKIVDLISEMASGVLGNIIGKEQAGPLSKILVDQGLKLFGLEIPESSSKQYMGVTISNILSETTEKVSQLPENIINGDERILRSFVNEALLTAITNNVPSSILNTNTNNLRQLPHDMNWVASKSGNYQILNKTIKFILRPEDAAQIYTRKAETLLDNLRKYQGWDGKTPVGVTAHIFQSTPLTRIAMIARDYVGGDNADKKRQILRLNSAASNILLKEPSLTQRGLQGKSWPRWYYVKLDNAVQSPNSEDSKVPLRDQDKSRPNEIDFKFSQASDSQYGIIVKIYLNEATSDRIKSVAKTAQPATFSKVLESILSNAGRKIINEKLVRLVIPQYAKNKILLVISGWIMNSFRSNLQILFDDYITQSDKEDYGVTIQIDIGLPQDLMKSLINLSVSNVGSFISKSGAMRPKTSVKSISGFKI